MSDQRRNVANPIDALRFDAIADLADLARPTGCRSVKRRSAAKS
jgi:hypothetical protein